jgi:hypothetical protein
MDVDTLFEMEEEHPPRTRKVLWLVLGGVGVLAVATYLVIAVYSSVNSVSVRFVNNTENAVTLSDCGPDIETIPAGVSAVINVYQPTKYCSVGVQGGSDSESAGRCLKMPAPLENGAAVHISDATANMKPCS